MVDPVSRRTFLAGVCGVAFSAIPTLSADAASAVKKLPNGKLSVNLKNLPALAAVGSSVRIGNFKGKPVALTKTGPTSFVAFSLICPHQGVTVIKDGDKWICDAHGSQFEANGDLNLGPATTGLPRIPAKFSKGQVVIG